MSENTNPNPHNEINETQNNAKTENSDAAVQSQTAQGIPSVSGKRKSNKKGGFLLFLVAVMLAGGAFAYFAFNKNEPIEAAVDDDPQPSLTSSKSLTLPPLPPQEPDEEEQIFAAENKPSAVIESESEPLPAPLPVTQGAIDADGNPVPTLDELKYAAPMMGMLNNGKNSSSGNGNRQPAALTASETHTPGTLENSLDPVATPSKSAVRIKNQSLILSKGTVIECILESRVDTTVPGMTTCVIPRDVYSMNGRVLLIEKGTKAIGEYQGSVANGLARIFMLWTELRTPKGISIALNSPAADALGAAGMGGYVDYHWWKRFGNALLFSLISDGFQYAINTADSHNNNGDVTYESTSDGMDEIIQEAMRQSGNIPPTLTKNQGERVSIFVARDLSFESVYGIKSYGNY